MKDLSWFRERFSEIGLIGGLLVVVLIAVVIVAAGTDSQPESVAVACVAALIAYASARAAERSADAARISAALAIPRVRITMPKELKQYEENGYTAFRVENLSATTAPITLRRWYHIREEKAPMFGGDRYLKIRETHGHPLFKRWVAIPETTDPKWKTVPQQDKLVLGPFDYVDLQVRTTADGLIDIGLGGISDAAYEVLSGGSFVTSIDEAIRFAKTGERPEREWRSAKEES